MRRRRQRRENDPAALRAKARAAQLQADMDNAADLFGGASVNGALEGMLLPVAPNLRV